MAISLSLDFITGAIAAIAAAPQIPVPTPNRVVIDVSALNKRLKAYVITMLKMIIPASIINSGPLCPKISSIFNLRP